MFSSFGRFDMQPFASLPQQFQDFFRCYPIDAMQGNKSDYNYGGKIFLPPSALNKLSMLNVRYPMLFELESPDSKRKTHSGVLEFIAEEGRVYLPNWMMDVLGVHTGSLLLISSTDLPLGNFVKLEPQSTDFLDISDPKAVLENSLRNFSTLTMDDIIDIKYNNKIYRIKVLEVKPENESHGICVLETDLVTDFAPPVGYVEPDYKKLQEEERIKKQNMKPKAPSIGSMSRRIGYAEQLNSSSSTHFSGEGQKLSGKIMNVPTKVLENEVKLSLDKQPAPLNLPDGQLFFGFPFIPPKKDDDDDDEGDGHGTKLVNFQGEGQSLRKAAKRKGRKEHTGSKSKATKSPEIIEID
ncbi:related to Ubiquitin fusion degradation protein 1 [Saccharomycodes ludwigii]|uniref:Related to Ubiquitin fusion degradation protein 1 n=1 Tax=Saccharomycodes ludwigii TaxID=36035 RepID=A0A376B146_9ASCO|nr:hypothetical protein SCDLUD_003900 [Saccharomycodes ludwigii]KAH3899620.1 hypothetical protein SCDLUD_003900 [Saccharomycodes ludwigii]SSD58408.1 related to Ubiquitin fusion degradation protein 1 [Saccharomycodes ludwigii]